MSYLNDYLEYSSGNECPDLFHLWGGMVTISASVSRKVWLPFEDVAMFPNIYVMYVGDAGNGKSWAMGKAKRLLAEIGLPYSGSLETPPGMWRFMAGTPPAGDSPGKPSPVRFTARWPDGELRDCHPMTIIANEFINFISLDEKGWVNALNDIYDEDNYHYRTKGQGEDNLLGPYIVLLGALTTEVSSDLQKARIISTGLARRTIFQYGQRTFNKPHALPVFEAHQKAARARCVEYLRKLNSPEVSGPFSWTDETKEWWTAWYNPHLAAVPTQNPSVRSWYASKSSQMIKIAMLVSLSESTDLEIRIPHFEAAKSYLDLLEEDLPKIFGGVGRNELAGVAVKMLEFVQYLPEPITMTKMRGQFFNSCKPPMEFDQCIEHLCRTEALRRFQGIIPQTQQILDIISTPPIMADFLAKFGGPSYAKPLEQQQTTDFESPSGPSPEAGPSTEP
jgi:hypothetical protein